jgi:alpha-glucoside transport system substrate-binding protein
VYDQWVNHEIPFNAPEVTAAWEKFGEIFQTEGNVVGGTQGVLSIPFGESPNAMFEKEPGCWLHRQANFISGFFPDKVQEDLDGNVGAAYFPSGIEGGFDGDPVLGAGDLAMMINDTEAARQLMEFMGTAEFGGPWAEAGGYLSAHREFDASLYPDELTRQLFSIAQEADVLRFDGSDQMPGAVGTGSFWTGIVDWISGEADLEQALTTIEESWPASGEGGESEATE